MLTLLVPANVDQPIEIVEAGWSVGSFATVLGSKNSRVDRLDCTLTDQAEDLSLALAVLDDAVTTGQPENSRATLLRFGDLGALHADDAIHGDVLVCAEELADGGLDFVDLGRHANTARALVQERIEEAQA